MTPRPPALCSGYDGALRAYAVVRGWIITDALIDELARELPGEGCIADLGCGIGLAALAMARRKPGAQLVGYDRDARRIAAARAAASRLGLPGARFEALDLTRAAAPGPWQGAYLVDVLHHVEPAAAAQLLAAVLAALAPGGAIAVKEVDRHPAWMRAVCRLTDAVMAPGAPVYFRTAAHWREQLERAGFEGVRSRPLPTCQPYPHILIAGRKRA